MKDFWEQRYSEEGYAYGTEPNHFLHSQRLLFLSGMKVLVVGDGEGRNGVWLAEQGCEVTTVDYSAAGVAKAEELALSRCVSLTTVCADLLAWEWPVAAFDAVVSVFLHFSSDIRPLLHHRMIEALRPGGLVLIEAFSKQQLDYKSGGPPVEDMLFSRELLARDFAMLDIRLLEERVVNLDEGRFHRGDGAVVRMLAYKP